MRRIRIFVAYDGTNYCGWQIQPNGITIEEKLNKALNRLTGEDIRVIGASRTDSGVHALGNVAVFDTESPIPPERFSYALNQRLPEDIVIVKSDEVPLDWHPRYQDNISKTYEYHIYNAQMPNPLKTRYCTFVSFPLDIGAMREVDCICHVRFVVLRFRLAEVLELEFFAYDGGYLFGHQLLCGLGGFGSSLYVGGVRGDLR